MLRKNDLIMVKWTFRSGVSLMAIEWSRVVKAFVVVTCLLLATLASAVATPTAAFAQEARIEELLPRLRLPPGFRIEVVTTQISNARSLARGERGTLFIGTRNGGDVYAITGIEDDWRADRVRVIAEGLNSPNGVAVRDGALFVAEIDRVIRFDDIENWLDDPPAPVVVNDNFPDKTHHGWKFIRFGPDGRLYLPVGAPCNVCKVADPYGTIMRMNADGSGLEVYVRGVRNSVGFDWDPATMALWFTDNGRDQMGDDVPPDELNRAPEAGLHFGFPFCHGGYIVDPVYGNSGDCERFTPPAQRLGPHVASLGMRFYTGTMFPAAYRNQIFIAEHGSWNRSVPIGYRISLVRLDEKRRVVSYEPFIEGWLGADRTAWGRPVDLEVMPDGSMLISDDRAGAIYRVSYAP